MTPTRSPELPDAHLVPSSAPFFTRMRSFSGYRSGSDDGHGDEDEQADEEQVDDELGEHEHDNEHDRLSGSTAGYDSYDDEHRDNDASPTMVDPDVRSDEEMAKVERKIADLEISNASLLAVNRTLEATKAKQRSEIVKLRRQLRESHLGLRPAPSFSVPISVTASSEAAGSAPGTDLSLARVLSDEEVYGDDEMDDPELDARWDRLASLVGVMRRRGEDAVAHGNEEMKPAGSRVLGWLEVEALNKAADEGEGISPSPSPGPAGPDDEIASELLSGAPSEGEAEER
jgi:hypothetical protein